MKNRRHGPSPLRLQRLERTMARQKARDARLLRNIVVGRSIGLPNEYEINRVLQSEGDYAAYYKRTGHIALVYLFRSELKERRGTAFYNSKQVELAIASIGEKARCPVSLEFSHFEISKKAFRVDDYGRHFHLSGRITKAFYADNGQRQPADVRAEELAISNNLFNEDMDETDRSVLWLGSLVAPTRADAAVALEPLELAVPAHLQGGPVEMIRPC